MTDLRVPPAASTVPTPGALLTLLVSIVAFCAVGVGTADAAERVVAEGSQQASFDLYDVELGAASRQTILTGFLTGGAAADIATVSLEAGNARVELFSWNEGTWAPSATVALEPGVRFVDVARVGDGDRILTFDAEGVSWIDFDAARERRALEVSAAFDGHPRGLHYAGGESRGPADAGEIPWIDVSRDLNGDGLSDLVLPQLDGFLVSVQRRDGTFTEPRKVGPPEPFQDQIAFGDKRAYGDVGLTALTIPWYLSRVHRMDADGDGRDDLAFWNEDRFDVYLQNATGCFIAEPQSLEVDVSVDSDGVYSHIFGYSGSSSFQLVTGLKKKTKRTVIRSVIDVNADGTADLVTQTLEGRSILKLRSRYDVYFGERTPSGLAFARSRHAQVASRPGAGGVESSGYSSLWLEDFSGDGTLDFFQGQVKIGVFAMFRVLVRRSIGMTAELYRLEKDTYPATPTARRSVQSKLQFSSEEEGGRDSGFFPFVLVGDVNGDRRADVLFGKKRNELQIFLSSDSPEVIAKTPVSVPLVLPGDERNTSLVDINVDGKMDVLMHHPTRDGAHRLTILMAR